MDPTLLRGVFGPGQKPYVVGITTATSTGTPMTMTFPDRRTGTLVIALMCRHAGGTAAPGTPTGFTSAANSTVDPDYRVAYKFCNGSEAPTFTSSATSATSMSAVVYAIRGASAAGLVGNGGVATATSTTPNPGSANAGLQGWQSLYIAYAMWNGSATVSEYPAQYCDWPATVTEGTNGGIAAITRKTAIITEDAGPFTISASLVNRAGLVFCYGFT